MNPPKAHILSGLNELVKPWRDGSRDDFENIPFEEMFCCIKNNFAPRKPEKLSEQNWRLIEQPVLSKKATSGEKILEKRIASLLKPQWVNQVPTASGFCRSGDRKRSIDLFFKSADSAYVFYELKVLPESGGAFDATVELLGYGLLYVFSRIRLDAYKECSLMKARTIHLRVLGTWEYYQKQTGKRTAPSKHLRDAISLSLNQFASACLPECEMDFGFDSFPQKFAWTTADREDDKKILSAVKGILPLFS